MTAHTLLVASPRRLFVDAVEAYFRRRNGWRVVGAVGDGLAAVAAVGRLLPEAVLVTDDLPRLGPALFAQQVRRRWPGVTVVLLGEAHCPDATVVRASAGGAEILDALRSPRYDEATAAGLDRRGGMVLLARLTRRERTVLRLLAEGHRMEEVAHALGVSAHTVRTHMQNLYEKLGCHSRVELLSFARRLGVVDLTEERSEAAPALIEDGRTDKAKGGNMAKPVRVLNR